MADTSIAFDRTSRAAWVAVNALGATWRYRLRHCTEAEILGSPTNRPTLLAFWHEYLIPGFYFLRGTFSTALVSPSRDGQRLAAILQRWGYSLARGSSTRNGQSAVQECVAALKGGRCVVITPDGPTGPRRKAKHGMLRIAQAASVPVVALAFRCRPCIRLRSWDRCVVPLPFAGITVTISSAIRPGDTPISDDDTVGLLADAERGMNG